MSARGKAKEEDDIVEEEDLPVPAPYYSEEDYDGPPSYKYLPTRDVM